jgi:hypothetical protein
MTEYVPPSPAEAARVYRDDQESDRQYRRLDGETGDRLRTVLTDPTEPPAARANALLLLLQRRDPGVHDLLPGLFDDPAIGRLAIRYCRPSEPAAADRLRRLLKAPRGAAWPDAAVALAGAKDGTVRPVLEGWLRHGNLGEFNVAIEGLARLDPGAAREAFRRSWDAGDEDEERRLVLAAAMLQLGDNVGAGLLEGVARRAADGWASFAGFALAGHDASRGYGLLLGILADGGAEAKRAVVMQVWNLGGSPHAFTADGVHEARAWLEGRLGRSGAAG